MFRLVRPDGTLAGLADIRMGGHDGSMLNIHKLEGHHSASLGPKFAQAVYAMLSQDPPVGSAGRLPNNSQPMPDDETMIARWQALLGSYLKGREVDVIFPKTPTPEAFNHLMRLVRSLSALADREGRRGPTSVPVPHPK